MLTYDLSGGGQPKYYRLYTCIREDILRAELLPGQKLPSKRALAEHLHISLATVSGAYEQLVDEGYLTAKPRSGYYVSAISRLPSGSAAQPRLRMLPADDAPAQEASGYGFRYSALTKLMREVIADCGTRLLEKPPHYGCAELRNAIAEYLLRYRGMLAQPECIVIGSGAEYLYGLVVQLLGRDRVYGLEDPGYEKVRQVYAANGAVCELLPMSDDGIRTDALQRTDATVLHVTPFHSFPTGITTSAAKRSEYLAWAAGRDAILIEDEPGRTAAAHDAAGGLVLGVRAAAVRGGIQRGRSGRPADAGGLYPLEPRRGRGAVRPARRHSGRVFARVRKSAARGVFRRRARHHGLF